MNAGKGILQKPGAWSSTEPGMLCNTLKHTALTSIDTQISTTYMGHSRGLPEIIPQLNLTLSSSLRGYMSINASGVSLAGSYQAVFTQVSV